MTWEADVLWAPRVPLRGGALAVTAEGAHASAATAHARNHAAYGSVTKWTFAEPLACSGGPLAF